MRQLGHGQSVMFFAPPDVDRRIKDTRRTLVKRPVSVVDILEWVMLETVASIEHHIPYWAQQGVSYKNRLAGWNQFDLASSPEAERLSVLHSLWVEKEARTLEEMYCPSTPPANRPPHPAFEIPDMKVRLDSLGVTSVIEASMDEEQEREVAHEIERESQVCLAFLYSISK